MQTNAVTNRDFSTFDLTECVKLKCTKEPPGMSLGQRRVGLARLVRVQVGESPRGGKAHEPR